MDREDFEALATEAMRDAVRCLVRRAGGGGATPASVRAVLARDRAAGHPDPWQWWFREATGLAVLVSTESVLLVTRPHGPDRPPKVLRAEFPPVLRAAVLTPADRLGGHAKTGPRPGPARSRASKYRQTLPVACPGCGWVRPLVLRPGDQTVRARPCFACAMAARKAGAA